MMTCSNCKHTITSDAKFCGQCGTKVTKPVQNKTLAYEPRYNLDYREALTLVKQVRSMFFVKLENEIEDTFGAQEYRKYFDHFYKSEYYKTFDLRTQQLAEEAYSIHSGPEQYVAQKVDKLLEHNFQGLIDHFIITYCKELHGMNLPEAILKYANTSDITIDKRQLILDFLDFEHEKDQVYTDLITIPKMKVKNAVQSFLFTQSQERIYFICDQTIFGSCREGFAMTEHALHWKSHFNPPQSVFYDEIKTIKREAEWLSINDLFFNVNPTMNLKMMKLLKKLQQLADLS